VDLQVVMKIMVQSTGRAIPGHTNQSGMDKEQWMYESGWYGHARRSGMDKTQNGMDIQISEAQRGMDIRMRAVWTKHRRGRTYKSAKY